MRLIDADALAYSREWLSDEVGATASFYVVHKRDITNAPTIDAVPVVRCKDCKNRFYNDFAHMYCCEVWGDGYDGVRDDGFCSYGERKADGE